MQTQPAWADVKYHVPTKEASSPMINLKKIGFNRCEKSYT